MATDTAFRFEEIGFEHPVIFYRACKQESFAFQRVESVANNSCLVSPVPFCLPAQ